MKNKLQVSHSKHKFTNYFRNSWVKVEKVFVLISDEAQSIDRFWYKYREILKIFMIAIIINQAE